MYRIIAPSGETHLTETVTYIRVHSSGVYLITDRRRAEGVAFRGTPYLFQDGAQVQEFDGAELVAEAEQENKRLKAQVTALSDQNDFQEECLVEMAGIVYA